MEPGDRVSIQSGMYEGKIGTLVDVEWEAGDAVVEIDSFGGNRHVELPVRDLDGLSGDDEELLDQLLGRVRQAVWQVFEAKQQIWWARRAADGASANDALLEEFQQFRARLIDEFDDEVASVLTDIRSDIDVEDADDLRAWLSDEASALDEAWRERADERKQSFFEEVVPDDELADIDQSAAQKADGSSFLDEAAARDQLVTRRLSSIIDDGLELWQRCEDVE